MFYRFTLLALILIPIFVQAQKRDNSWGSKQLCRVTEPVEFKVGANTYQTQTGDLVDCTYSAQTKAFTFNGNGKIQPKATIAGSYAKPPVEIVKQGSQPQQAFFSEELRKKTQVMNEPDASWFDRDLRAVQRKTIDVLEGNNPTKMIFVRGSQIVDNFIDPYDQSDPACVRDKNIPKCDKRPELMYEVEVLNLEMDKKTGKPLDANKNGIPDTYEQYRDKKLPKDTQRIAAGWVRSDFLTFESPQNQLKEKKPIHLPTYQSLPATIESESPKKTKSQTQGGLQCVGCSTHAPQKPEAIIREKKETLTRELSREQNIMADLRQMRELSCGSSLGGFNRYEKLWNKKYDELKRKGALRSKLTKQQLFAIDVMARTKYGELLWPKMCHERHWIAWSRIALNRAYDEINGANHAWTNGHKSKKLEDVIPHVVTAKVNGRWQYEVWHPSNKNQKKMGCVLNSEDWDKMAVISARAVLEQGEAIKKMTNSKGMSDARCYYSGKISRPNKPCKGQLLLDLQIDGAALNPKSERNKYQCIVAQSIDIKRADFFFQDSAPKFAMSEH